MKFSSRFQIMKFIRFRFFKNSVFYMKIINVISYFDFVECHLKCTYDSIQFVGILLKNNNCTDKTYKKPFLNKILHSKYVNQIFYRSTFRIIPEIIDCNTPTSHHFYLVCGSKRKKAQTSTTIISLVLFLILFLYSFYD